MEGTKGENRKEGDQVRVMMIGPSRSTSSVFCKCMTFVPGIDIFFDTYYFAFEAEINLHSIGIVVDHDNDKLGDDVWRKAAEIICSEDCSGNRVKIEMLKYLAIKRMLDKPDPRKRAIFCKTVSQAMGSDHFRFLPNKSSGYKYSFLLRHPAKVFRSWRNVTYYVLKEVGDEDGNKITKSKDEYHMLKDAPAKFRRSPTFFKNLFDSWVYVKENLDPNPTIIDSDDLHADPARMLSKYCAAVGIPYTDNLLQWDSSPATTDEWKCAFMPPRDFWYISTYCDNALHSSEFYPPGTVPSEDELSDDINELVEISMPFYEEMYKARLV